MRDLPPNLPLVDESFPEEWSARLQRSTTYGDLVLECDRLCATLHTFTALETGRRLWWADFDEIAMYNLPINRGPLKVWAVDRSWSWHTESGGYRTYLGAPGPVIEAVLAHPELEAFEIPVSCRLDAVRTPLPRSLGSS